MTPAMRVHQPSTTTDASARNSTQNGLEETPVRRAWKLK